MAWRWRPRSPSGLDLFCRERGLLNRPVRNVICLLPLPDNGPLPSSPRPQRQRAAHAPRFFGRWPSPCRQPSRPKQPRIPASRFETDSLNRRRYKPRPEMDGACVAI